MEVLEERKTALRSKTILFRAYRPKTASPVTLQPCEDKTGRLYTGQGARGYFELLTVQEKAELPFIIDHYTKVVITDGKVLDMDNPIDEANWKWIQKHPYIALKKETGRNSSRSAVYYVEDKLAEASRRVRESEKVDKARIAVREQSTTNRVRTAMILGLVTAKNMEDEEVLDWLLEQSNFIPETVLEAVDPEFAERNSAKIFFNELLKYKVVERQTDGNYKVEGNEGMAIAHTPDLVLDWMLDGANAEYVKILRLRLTERKKTGI